MPIPFRRALLIGVVAGMRSMTAPAVVSASVSKLDAETLGSLNCLGYPKVARVLNLAAGAELAADKLPIIGPRTDAGPLAFRAISGAVCGAAVSKRNNENIVVGAIAGGVAAVLAAHLFYSARKHLNNDLGIADPLLAVAEDTVAWTLGGLSVDRY